MMISNHKKQCTTMHLCARCTYISINSSQKKKYSISITSKIQSFQNQKSQLTLSLNLLFRLRLLFISRAYIIALILYITYYVLYTSTIFKPSPYQHHVKNPLNLPFCDFHHFKCGFV